MTYDAQAVRDAYDKMADAEDEFEKGFSLRNEIPRAFIKKYLKPSDVVLDAGGGTAVNAILMAQVCKRVTLVDISPKILDLAKQNIEEAGLAQKIELVEGDISDLNQYGDESFSFVVCVGGTLSYLSEKAQDALRDLVRVADKGAVMIIGCDSKYGFMRWLVNETESESLLDVALEAYKDSEYEAAEGVFVHLYTVPELTELIKNAGCEVIEIASTPILVDTWDQNKFPEEQREKLTALELKVCTEPVLLGTGHHLICIARKL